MLSFGKKKKNPQGNVPFSEKWQLFYDADTASSTVKLGRFSLGWGFKHSSFKSFFFNQGMGSSGKNTAALAMCNHRSISSYRLLVLLYFLSIFLRAFCFPSVMLGKNFDCHGPNGCAFCQKAETILVRSLPAIPFCLHQENLAGQPPHIIAMAVWCWNRAWILD